MSSTEEIYEYDKKLKEKYGPIICGSDEVGTGAVAGPIVAAAVVFGEEPYIEGVMDSKRVGAGKRARLTEQIKKIALVWHVSYIWPDLIDRYGVRWANRKVIVESSTLCEKDLKVIHDKEVSLFVVDQAPDIDLCPQYIFPKADSTSYCVAAASILAKVSRDDLMNKLAACYPDYLFARNKGYISDQHVEAIKKYGYIENIHRMSYKVKALEGYNDTYIKHH